MAEKKKPQAQVSAAAERQKKLQASYQMASNQLRAEFRAQFVAYRKAALHSLGIHDWEPEPTPAEKAQAQIDALYEEFPELKK